MDVDFPCALDTPVHGEAARQEMLPDLKWMAWHKCSPSPPDGKLLLWKNEFFLILDAHICLLLGKKKKKRDDDDTNVASYCPLSSVDGDSGTIITKVLTNLFHEHINPPWIGFFAGRLRFSDTGRWWNIMNSNKPLCLWMICRRWTKSRRNKCLLFLKRKMSSARTFRFC